MSPKSPRAPATRSEQKAATQRLLLEAARRCFERQGYAGTAIGDIAREAGVAHGTFYVHFESREAVADVLLQGFNDNLSRALVPLLTADHGSLEATVREAAKLFLVALDDDRALVRFYAERAASGLPPDALATGINPPALAALTEALVARAGDGDGDRVDLAAHGLLALWLRVGLRYALLGRTSRKTAEDVLVQLTTGALSALLTVNPRPRGARTR